MSHFGENLATEKSPPADDDDFNEGGQSKHMLLVPHGTGLIQISRIDLVNLVKGEVGMMGDGGDVPGVTGE